MTISQAFIKKYGQIKKVDLEDLNYEVKQQQWFFENKESFTKFVSDSNIESDIKNTEYEDLAPLLVPESNSVIWRALID